MIQSKIWVFCEQRKGQLAGVGLELLGKALGLAFSSGRKVAGILIGHQLGRLSEELSKFGANELLVADHHLLVDYCNQTYTKVLEDAVHRYHPETLLLGATAMGTDLSARLAARLRTGLCAHCIDLGVSPDGKLQAVVPGWGGNVNATIHCPIARPQMATVMPGVFDMPKAREPTSRIIPMEVNVMPEDVSYRILKVEREGLHESSSSLEKAEVIVAGGSGVGSVHDWKYLEKFALTLNGAVGATRPPVDEGWAKEAQMIGQSGRTIHPRLYIGIAISGQMHHMVGIKEAEFMVAINQDPEAPIFKQCDLGLVGDFREILPPLIKAIQKFQE